MQALPIYAGVKGAGDTVIQNAQRLKHTVAVITEVVSAGNIVIANQRVVGALSSKTIIRGAGV